MAIGAVVGGFLRANLLRILAGALIAGAGWYIVSMIQENGRLETKLEQEEDKVEAWESRFDQLQKDRKTIAKWDNWLAEQRALVQSQNREYSRQLEELRDEVTGLKDYLDMQPPADFREFLCNSGLVLGEACEDGSGEVSYRLQEDSG